MRPSSVSTFARNNKKDGTNLSDANHEQAIRLLAVVARELAKHLRQARVVRSGTDETHRKDGVDGDLQVVVVRIAREGVHDREDRVGRAEDTEGERNCSSDHGLAVVHLEGEMSAAIDACTDRMARTRWLNCRIAMSVPTSSPIEMSAIPMTARAW